MIFGHTNLTLCIVPSNLVLVGFWGRETINTKTVDGVDLGKMCHKTFMWIQQLNHC